MLLVDDAPVMIRLVARMLDDEGVLRFATSGGDALRLARELVPDVILLGAELPDLNGFEVCAALKADPSFADVPVTFITSHGAQSVELDGLAVGAADFITKPVSEPLLPAHMRTQLRVRRLTAALRRLSATDALTQLANRRSFDEIVRTEWNRASRRDSHALVTIDVDHFKAFNDARGHPAGDACVHAVAGARRAACQRHRREGGRSGVAMLLTHTSIDGAISVAQRVRAEARALAIPHAHSWCSCWLTASVGMACFSAATHDGVIDAAALRQVADDAMYREGRPSKLIGARIHIAERRRAKIDVLATWSLQNTVLESASEVSIIATDPDLVITVFNRGAESLLGYRSEHVVGRTTPMLHDVDEVTARAQKPSRQLGYSVQGGRCSSSRAHCDSRASGPACARAGRE